MLERDMLELLKQLENDTSLDSKSLVAKLPTQNLSREDAINIALCVSCENNLINCLKALIIEKANVNYRETEYEQETPLIKASSTENIECVKLLLEAKANVHAGDYQNDTALHWSAYYGNLQIVNLLLDAKANANLKNSINKNTVLMESLSNHVCVKALLQNTKIPLDLEIKNEKNQTALDIALQNHYRPQVHLLLTHGAIIRNPQLMYNHLLDFSENDYRTFSDMNTLYRQHSHLDIDSNQPILRKIHQLDELHKKNIYQSIDQGTSKNKPMPTVLLDIVAKYINPLKIELKNKKQSFFNLKKINPVIAYEKKFEKSLEKAINKTTEPPSEKKPIINHYNFRPSTLKQKRSRLNKNNSENSNKKLRLR